MSGLVSHEQIYARNNATVQRNMKKRDDECLLKTSVMDNHTNLFIRGNYYAKYVFLGYTSNADCSCIACRQRPHECTLFPAACRPTYIASRFNC